MKCPQCSWNPQEALQALCDDSSVKDVAKSLGVALDTVYKRLRGDHGKGMDLDAKIHRRWKQLGSSAKLED